MARLSVQLIQTKPSVNSLPHDLEEAFEASTWKDLTEGCQLLNRTLPFYDHEDPRDIAKWIIENNFPGIRCKEYFFVGKLAHRVVAVFYISYYANKRWGYINYFALALDARKGDTAEGFVKQVEEYILKVLAPDAECLLFEVDYPDTGVTIKTAYVEDFEWYRLWLPKMKESHKKAKQTRQAEEKLTTAIAEAERIKFYSKLGARAIYGVPYLVPAMKEPLPSEGERKRILMVYTMGHASNRERPDRQGIECKDIKEFVEFVYETYLDGYHHISGYNRYISDLTSKVIRGIRPNAGSCQLSVGLYGNLPGKVFEASVGGDWKRVGKLLEKTATTQGVIDFLKGTYWALQEIISWLSRFGLYAAAS